MGILSQSPAQPLLHRGSEVPGVVVKDDMRLVGFGGQVARTFGNFSESIVGIVVVESLGHGLAGQIGFQVPFMQPQVSQSGIGDHVHGWHDGEVLPIGGRTINAGERNTLFLEECRGAVTMIRVAPVVVTQFEDHFPDLPPQAIQLPEKGVERGQVRRARGEAGGSSVYRSAPSCPALSSGARASRNRPATSSSSVARRITLPRSVVST